MKRSKDQNERDDAEGNEEPQRRAASKRMCEKNGLTKAHRRMLEKDSAISPEVIEAAKIFSTGLDDLITGSWGPNAEQVAAQWRRVEQRPDRKQLKGCFEGLLFPIHEIEETRADRSNNSGIEERYLSYGGLLRGLATIIDR